MTVNYKGAERDFNYRLAEISYNENETRLMQRMEQVLNIRGWNVNIITDGYASCVVEDREEYAEFVKDYKEVKKAVKLWEKFGF
jgi:hypothetical protein